MNRTSKREARHSAAVLLAFATEFADNDSVDYEAPLTAGVAAMSSYIDPHELSPRESQLKRCTIKDLWRDVDVRAAGV